MMAHLKLNITEKKIPYRDYILITLSSLLILLWVYTAGSKLIDFEAFKKEMYNQVFPRIIANILLYALPAIEIIAMGLLYVSKTRLAGFLLSLLLMLGFTIYIGLALLNVYSRMPCSCGGVLKHMGWQTHFIFNLVFTAVAASGFILTIKERRKQSMDSIALHAPLTT